MCNLCRLINDSLLLYTEQEVINLTKEKEKDILIALSQLYREIQAMKQQFDCELELQINCLIKILADLIILLTVENQFVRHLVGNIFVVISEIVSPSASKWGYFVGSLFIGLKLAFSSVASQSFVLSINGAGDSKCDSSSIVALKPRLVNANWSTAMEIVRVSRDILKCLKEEDDDELRESYIGLATSFLSEVDWNFIGEIQVGQSCETKENDPHNSSALDRNSNEKKTKIMFLGMFIQFLCSLVEQSCGAESEVGSEDHHPILCLIISFTPKLLSCCLMEQGICVNTCLSQYFRHKLLMLMLRISYRTSLGYFTLISWLQFLHDRFEMLLQKPMITVELSQVESLEGSPFLSSLYDGEVHGINSHHLQRRAVLLFMRCCFGLISLTSDTSKQRACGTLCCCSSYSTSDLGYCGRNKGFLELYEWLQQHLPIDVSVGCENYNDECIGFALSFLQLYMHEDDILFKVLLQLLSIHSCLEQRSNVKNSPDGDVKEDILVHIAHIFNPVNLFHLFLAELHYDHQVLLDYLISKDIGISCAEYLLRCLRYMCSSWHLFVSFSMNKKVVDHSSCKKRKISLDAYNFQVEESSALVKCASPSVEIGEEYFEYSHKKCRTRRKLFNEARNCLLSLKDSVQNLQQKDLFPYNAEVLLKRLTKFEELCFD